MPAGVGGPLRPPSDLQAATWKDLAGDCDSRLGQCLVERDAVSEKVKRCPNLSVPLSAVRQVRHGLKAAWPGREDSRAMLLHHRKKVARRTRDVCPTPVLLFPMLTWQLQNGL